MRELDYYFDYFKKLLSEAKIEFKIIEDTVPPILNKQRWFVIEPTSGLTELTEGRIEEFMWTVLYKKYVLPFLFVKERQSGLFKRIYFLDFNLPVEKVRERFSVIRLWSRAEEIPLKPFPVKSFPSSEESDFFSHKFFLYDEIPIISDEFRHIHISSIIKSVLEGHKILFEIMRKIICHPKGENSYMYFNIKPYNVRHYDENRRKMTLCNEFYYYDGIIEFYSLRNASIIDNHFLAGLKELLETLCSVIIEIFKRKDLAVFYEDLAVELSKRVYADYERNTVMISFSKEEIEKKLFLFQEIAIPCIIIIKYFLGETLEPVKDEKEIEKQKEYLIKNLKIIEEILSMVE
ncbi:MAG: hypothetical protein ABIM98_07440 [candidate division WOR-3 bacterium]